MYYHQISKSMNHYSEQTNRANTLTDQRRGVRALNDVVGYSSGGCCPHWARPPHPIMDSAAMRDAGTVTAKPT
jgi:hypothetical protein